MTLYKLSINSNTACQLMCSFMFRQYICSKQFYYILLDGQATYNAHFGQGTGAVALEQVACTGSETSLLSCPSNIIFQTDCSHSDDAGVICQGKFANMKVPTYNKWVLMFN